MTGRALFTLCLRRWFALTERVALYRGQGMCQAAVVGSHRLTFPPVYKGHPNHLIPVRLHQCWSWRPPEKAPEIGETWSYSDVKHWGEHFKTCKGERQSPVDLDTTQLKQDAALRCFSHTNFNSTCNIKTTIANNGHSAQVTYISGDLSVRGGGLLDEYRVAQYHWHWGSVDNKGSEHTVDGRAYPMELHVVTYNQKYGNFTEAIKNRDGLAVLGFFYKVTAQDNPAYKPIIEALSKITSPGTVHGMETVRLIDLFPEDIKQYYRYEGGLTTPPCSEIVTWTVFRNPIPISAAQLSAFRKLKSSEKEASGAVKPLQNNFRPVQPLSGRVISVNWKGHL